MIKHGINSFLAMSIVFANQLADICEYTGANIDEVVKGVKSDPRIGEKAYLSAGIGFSGGTLGRDLVVLKQKNNENNGLATLFNTVYALNTERKQAIFKKIEKILEKHQISSPSVGILGLTYKPGTSTLRRSLPLDIVNLLLERKYKVKVFDPKADYRELNGTYPFKIASDIREVANSVDLLVFLTEWPEFKEYDWSGIPRQMKTPLVLDAKNFLNKQKMISVGFNYYGIGR
jgi:UDPglucose 6-dehydrogenase